MTYPFRVVDCGGQGTQEWIEARLGIPSASNYSKLITTKGKRSTSFDGYCMGLAAEVLTGKPYSWHKSELTITSASPYSPDTAIDPNELDALDWGTYYEPEARAYYSLLTDTDVVQVDFCKHPNLEAGCSPDGLIDVNQDGMLGGLEIKCPKNPQIHMEYYKSGEIPTKYIQQVQGCMWITGRGFWDFMSYHPKLKPFICRVYRNDDLITAMTEEVTEAVQLIEQYVREFKFEGVT